MSDAVLQSMLNGEDYNCLDPYLDQLRRQCMSRMQAFNQAPVADTENTRQLLKALIPNIAPTALVYGPFFCSYGINLTMHDASFINFNCTILDNAPVTIGARCMLGPNVQIYTAAHDLDPQLRAQGMERALPVVLEEDVWVGGGAIILPGVTIGRNSVIGAGSVVTKDIPANSRAVGNPTRLL